MASRTPPRQSIEDRPSTPRQSSTSSTDSETQTCRNTRRRKSAPGKARRSSGQPRPKASREEFLSISEQARRQTGSRRGSTSSMRNSAGPTEPLVRYTPTTHRISKAKKGQRVHACNFEGCDKVFTRAEHKRRHELNHAPDAAFPCPRPDCSKAFHRPDLLQRHVERHDMELLLENVNPSLTRLKSLSTASETSAVTATSMASPPPAAVRDRSQQMTGVPIGSLIHPSPGGEGHPPHKSAQMAINPFAVFPPGSIYPGIGGLSDESVDYSDSASSASDYHTAYRHPHRDSIASSTGIDFYSTVSSPTWNNLPPNIFPSNIIEEQGHLFAPSHADPSISIPLSPLDGDEWLVIKRALSTTKDGRLAGDGGGIFDTVRWHDCLACYWRYFAAMFPIVHRPTYTANTSPLMDCVMVAIGSQYATHPSAKHYSLASLEVASTLLAKRDNVTSQSRLTDLQTIFLLEMVTKFRSRRADINVSSQFRTLCASLRQSRHWISTNPLAVLRSYPPNPTISDLKKAHRFWLEHETRRRILQAASILDADQAVLFDHAPRPRIRTRDGNTKPGMPLSCSSDLWESSPIEDWASIATNYENDNVPATTDTFISLGSKALDFFQSRLLLSHILAPNSEGPHTDEGFFAFQQAHKMSLSPGAELSYHALLAAQNTPIRKLLIVSGESWLFGKKVENEGDFRTAKQGLREWVHSSKQSTLALWHATKLLCTVFNPAEPSQVGSIQGASDKELTMLHEHWAVYLASLICWACGFNGTPLSPATTVPSRANSIVSEAFSPSSSSSTSSFSTAHPSLLDPVEADHEMRVYLQDTNVDRAEDLINLAPQILENTKGLLEVVRTRKLGGTSGGLLNEAERVLYRLVEGRSRLFHF